MIMPRKRSCTITSTSFIGVYAGWLLSQMCDGDVDADDDADGKQAIDDDVRIGSYVCLCLCLLGFLLC